MGIEKFVLGSMQGLTEMVYVPGSESGLSSPCLGKANFVPVLVPGLTMMVRLTNRSSTLPSDRLICRLG